MKLNEKVKKLLITVGIVAIALVAGVQMLLGGIEHIEDTNGATNYALQTITPQQIVDMSTGSIGGPNITRSSLLGSTVEFSAKKFTGVAEILYDNFLLPSDFEINLTGYEIYGGNFQLVVVHDDQIVATLEPGLFVDYRLEDVTGHVALRIAGESASFTFSTTEFDYNLHSHHEDENNS